MPVRKPSRPELEEGRSHKGVEPKSGLIFWWEKARQFKSRCPLRKDTILREGIVLIRMATSQPTEIEGEVSVGEAVKEILAEMEAEEQDPIEGMGNVQIAKIYHRMKPEDQRLFRQFKRFHKQYYETHRHDAPSHQLTRGIVQQMFPGLPSADADTIGQGKGRTAGHRATQGAVQAAGTGGSGTIAELPATTRGT